MKLAKFKVQNFRGLKGEHNEIQFKKSDIIFLIGQNNTGKSTFLRAYEFFTNSKQKATLDDFYNQDITNTIKMEKESHFLIGTANLYLKVTKAVKCNIGIK